ncbi:MAG: hypothetical protein AAF627_19880, partial [Myxococcota bacterium]
HLDACAACYRTCASIAEEAGWPSEAIRHRFATAFVLHQSLELEEMAGELDAAAEAMQGPLAREPDLTSGLGYYRALLASTTGDHLGARESANLAAEVAEQAGLDLTFVTASMTAAEASLQLGDLDSALRRYASLETSVTQRAQLYIGPWLANFAWALTARTQLTGSTDDEANARSLLGKAMRVVPRGGLWHATTVLNMAELELVADNLKEADEWLAKFTEVGGEAFPGLRQEANLLSGEIALSAVRLEAARRHFESALQLQAQSSRRASNWRAKAGLALILLSQDEADARSQLALATQAVYRASTGGWSRPAALMRFQQIVVGGARLLVAQKQIEAALEWAQLSLRLGLSRLEAASVLSQLSSDELVEWRGRVAAFRRAERRLSYLDRMDDSRSDVELRLGLRTRERLRTELEERERALAEFLAARADPPSILRAAELRSLLAPNEVALLSLVGGRDLEVALVISAQRVQACHSSQCWALISQLFESGARHAYVLAPPGKRLPSAVVLERTSSLEGLNTSQLPDLSLLSNRPPRRVGLRLVVGDPGSDLPGARREARTAAAAQPGSRLVMGPEATEARVLAELRRASELHFAGHGPSAGTSEPALRLAKEDMIRLPDLLTEPIDLSFAFLSGCNTASTTQAYGASLPEALLLRRTRAIVATHEELDDETGRAFAESFYGASADGEAVEPASAFRIAMREIARVRGWRSMEHIELYGLADVPRSDSLGPSDEHGGTQP